MVGCVGKVSVEPWGPEQVDRYDLCSEDHSQELCGTGLGIGCSYRCAICLGRRNIPRARLGIGLSRSRDLVSVDLVSSLLVHPQHPP